MTMFGQLPSGAPVQSEEFPVQNVSLVSAVVSALNILDQVRPHMLVTYNWGSMNWWAAQRFRINIPHVHIEDGFGPEERKRQLRRRIVCRRILLNNSTTTTVLPSLTLLKIAAEQWSLPAKRICHIANGIDLSRFTKVRHAGGASDPVVIGTVATLRPEKNLGRLISLFDQAARRTSVSLQLVIVGGGSELEKLQKLARQSAQADHIRFAGPDFVP